MSAEGHLYDLGSMLSCLEILSTTNYDNVSSGEMVIGVTVFVGTAPTEARQYCRS